MKPWVMHPRGSGVYLDGILNPERVPRGTYMIEFLQTPDSFMVEEQLFYDPSGEGDHVFAQIRKRGLSTRDACRRISERTGVPLKVIRRAGMKDRDATAIQWFSWPAADQRQELTDGENFEVLRLERHNHGLSLGHIAVNRFSLLLKAVDLQTAAQRFEDLDRFANFYGNQRFGSDDPEEPRRPHPNDRGGRARDGLSVWQSALFNGYLRQRLLERGDGVDENDLWQRQGAKVWFQDEDLEALKKRFQEGEITPTGPMYGWKIMLTPSEKNYLQARDLEPLSFKPWGKAARGARRALWVFPTEKQTTIEGDHLRISFALPSGSYATTLLLAAYFPELITASPREWPNFSE